MKTFIKFLTENIHPHGTVGWFEVDHTGRMKGNSSPKIGRNNPTNERDPRSPNYHPMMWSGGDWQHPIDFFEGKPKQLANFIVKHGLEYPHDDLDDETKHHLDNLSEGTWRVTPARARVLDRISDDVEKDLAAQMDFHIRKKGGFGYTPTGMDPIFRTDTQARGRRLLAITTKQTRDLTVPEKVKLADARRIDQQWQRRKGQIRDRLLGSYEVTP